MATTVPIWPVPGREPGGVHPHLAVTPFVDAVNRLDSLPGKVGPGIEPNKAEDLRVEGHGKLSGSNWITGVYYDVHPENVPL